MIDINECEEYGVCDQLCFNSYGKYQCSCESDYKLEDNHKCKVKGNHLHIFFKPVQLNVGYK